MAAPQNCNVLAPFAGSRNSIGNGNVNGMAFPTAPTMSMPPMMQPVMVPNPNPNLNMPQLTSTRPPPPPLDTMRAYRACLNCRNRKSKCDLDVNQGRPAALFVELTILLNHHEMRQQSQVTGNTILLRKRD
ncbi:hypothetical protein LOCC1_G001964 [Lachnellula occidentalis]|uniref:Zn(2)-C6 fungal-type domain-containing protein n=1 Tax=Lachnellula occidentalis TaxID=215460 RepID=A0A8H8UJG4_9HELO|nr:hypothetical protein LOCC1_G001964 [Lachnellula occidentalis]